MQCRDRGFAEHLDVLLTVDFFHKDPAEPKRSWKGRTKEQTSHFMISNYITKL